jgi:hypothetical protein
MRGTPIHDWTDEQYYIELKDETNPTRWAWEFLRRNPEYQADYRRFVEYPDYDKDGQDVKNGKWKGTIWHGAKFYIDAFHYTDPPANIGETYEEYKSRCPDGEIIPFAGYLEYKYHFQPTPKAPETEFSDPTFEWFWFEDINYDTTFGSEFAPWELDIYPDYDSFKGSHFFEEYRNKYIERMRRYGSKQQVVILAFDIAQPIEKQLNEAKLMLQERITEYNNSEFKEELEYVKKPSNKSNMFPLYLRILDAVSLGVGLTEIGREIYKHERNSDTNNVKNKVKNNLEAAIRWRDEDYWKIGR